MKAIFNAITYTGNKALGASGFVKYKKISCLNRHVKFIERKYPDWLWITYYNRETNEKGIIKKAELLSPAKKEPFFP